MASIFYFEVPTWSRKKSFATFYTLEPVDIFHGEADIEI